MKHLALKADTVERSRQLRRDATDAERALWQGLRDAFPDAHFRRQVPLGPYFADFASHRHHLVIEVDGGQHGEAQANDDARTRYIAGEGYRVLRFWNNDVLDNLDGVLTTIDNALNSPPPCGEGRVGAPAASAAEETFALSDSLAVSCGADAPRPHPYPPHKGEGV